MSYIGNDMRSNKETPRRGAFSRYTWFELVRFPQRPTTHKWPLIPHIKSLPGLKGRIESASVLRRWLPRLANYSLATSNSSNPCSRSIDKSNLYIEQGIWGKLAIAEKKCSKGIGNMKPGQIGVSTMGITQ